ncbi:MAG: hypothetical protein GY800_05895 [Planctomycetes bacterium]|nr:hypothetical protein [Planctomycetota bacterium]
MVWRHRLSVSLILVLLSFTGVAAFTVNVQGATALSPCCGSDCSCPPGCSCCGDDHGAGFLAAAVGADSDAVLGEERSWDSEPSLWHMPWCGHTAVLLNSAQDPYMPGPDPLALFLDTSSRRGGSDTAVIEDVSIPPTDKVPRPLS